MEDEGEIEYLDEDEDLVQQYVQTAQPSESPAIKSVQSLAGRDLEEEIAPLLVERKRKVTKTENDDDSDYDPSEDYLPPRRKKRVLPPRKVKVPVMEYPKTSSVPKMSSNRPQNLQNLSKTYENKLKNLPNLTIQKKVIPKLPTPTSSSVRKIVRRVENLNYRKQMDIRIPDYDDPLCLPVKALRGDDHEARKLKYWNNLCLEQLKKLDTSSKPQRGSITSSTKTIVLKNVKNKYTGRVDTSIQSRTVLITDQGEKKLESFQSILPKYQEKKVLTSYPLVLGSHKYAKHTYEAILTKEEQKEGDVLVVYKPREAVSAVYKFIKKPGAEEEDPDIPCADKQVLKEATCAKVCAPCYQCSWRGMRKRDKQENVTCNICSRTYVSVYNLLAHLKTNHTAKEVAAHKNRLSRNLASMIDYHYRCRICQEQFLSIKSLRKHVTKHQGSEVFKCEIGNHMAS